MTEISSGNTGIIHHLVFREVSPGPLVTFRIGFGLLTLFSVLRFMSRGWVEEFYVEPAFHFTYYGLEFIKPLSAGGMYTLFVLIALSAAGIALGFFYRASALFFFLAFTFVELIDKTYYLNHYYFVSLIGFLLIWLPAGRFYSVDNLLFQRSSPAAVPAVCINIIKFQLALVYFYAGLAKLNADWLIYALPLKIWLPAHTSLPLVGSLMDEEWVAYAFSWFGAVYDLCIPFLLLNRRSLPYAYAAVVVFHVATWLLFPIGVFPWVMIVSTLIFFPVAAHERFLSLISRPFRAGKERAHYDLGGSRLMPGQPLRKVIAGAVLCYCMFQLIWPWRFVLYPGKLFWTEQGYRFSWRVMLMEKAGTAFFYVKDARSGMESEVDNSEFLTPAQEKMMSTQPDMILQYAHYLAHCYAKKGYMNPSVRVVSYVALNGRGSRPFIDSQRNLAGEKESFRHKDWVLPYQN
jgi:hypothetical protein